MASFIDYRYEDFTYKLYVPSRYHKEKSTSLMVMLHGCKQNPDDFARGTKMNEVAERENFLVLYPAMNHLFDPFNPADSNPDGCWNWFLDYNQHRRQGHPMLIDKIIDEVKSNFNIDLNKVYAVGLSAGAAMACILGVTYPDVFSGLGICSGLAYNAADVFIPVDPTAEAAKYIMLQGVSDPFDCGNSAFDEMAGFQKRMPVIVFQGVCDTTVHPINGQQVIIQWIQTNFLVEGGIGKASVVPSGVKADIINERSFTQHIYNDKNCRPLMELWMIDGMGHAWCGGNAQGSFTDPLGPDASEIIWKFFVKQQNV
ncbi:PHB depolymerase family esterase [Aneurinibacillus sp. Ricciae_BoGa-3]|uniref:extracellular catalytic domain type 1 short-chain-length polyhydroxyalkanoate depolymerase n=1 Tax=Aneurinibacillus sp. Ricciae_BoGa-3 TaxID=3022697 RepID=UPI0023423145|nr:PHB depolymerase family esterase [Aneurinibacillus sp. Ricciae_BoGa-3]WCK55287.1 PHB depolymerase family esterase [Aneurinibacillus sp. Ricciae_BoGa-3]